MINIIGKDPAHFVGLEEEAEEMRSKQHDVKLNNETIIILGYLCKEMLEMVTECKAWLFFEQANCYSSCFSILRRLLKVVDKDYLSIHSRLAEFFNEGQELERNGDRLCFVNVPVAKPTAGTVTKPAQDAPEIQTNKRPVKLCKKIEKGVRRHLISKLTDKRAKMVSMFEYSSDGSYWKDNDLGVVNVIESDLTFEPGDPDTLVRVLIRPDMQKKAVITTLYAIVKKVSGHDGEDWMAEFEDAIDRVAASLKARP